MTTSSDASDWEPLAGNPDIAVRLDLFGDELERRLFMACQMCGHVEVSGPQKEGYGTISHLMPKGWVYLVDFSKPSHEDGMCCGFCKHKVERDENNKWRLKTE